MNPSLHAALQSDLDTLAAAHRARACPPITAPDRVHARLADREVVSFCSNDYLGLAAHPQLAAAAARAAHDYGVGATASRLVAGDHPDHRALESELAAHLGFPTTLLFPSGFQANLGLLTALAGPEDLIASDAANHASIIDGCRLSRARIAIYAHGDPDAARAALATPGRHRRRLLVTESLFSMDGDVPPLAALATVAREAGAFFIVDEAHAFGVFGAGGRGLCQEHNLQPDFLVATLGKALGCAGGLVATSQSGRDYLVNRARAFIYTTAPPPPIAAAARVALALIAGPEGQDRRARLHGHARLLRQHPALASPLGSRGPVFPIVLGSDASALQAANQLLERGLFVQAIRPPTVPSGTARLRLTISARHTQTQLQDLLAALSDLPL